MYGLEFVKTRFLTIIVVSLVFTTIFTPLTYAETREGIRIGHSATEIEVNPVSNMVYVIDKGRHELPDGTMHSSVFRITVIDGTTNEVIDHISIDFRPLASLAVNPITNMIYTGHMEGIVYVIDGSSNEIVSQISVPNKPHSLAINTNTNMIYVGDTYNRFISIIDGSINKVVDKFYVGESTARVAVNSNTGTIYVADPDIRGSPTNDYNIFAIDENSFDVQKIDIENRPVEIVVNPISNLVYVTVAGNNAFQNNKILVIDGNTNKLIETMDIGVYYGIDINEETNMIYVTDGVNSISIIDGYNNEIIETVQISNQVKDIAVNQNSGIVYLSTNSRLVSMIDSSNMLVEFNIPEPTETETALSILSMAGVMGLGAIVPIAALTGIILLIEYLRKKRYKDHPELEEKVAVKWQTIIAAIPIVIPVFIVFYRINKVLKGGLLLMGVYASLVLVPLFLIIFGTSTTFLGFPPLIYFGIMFLPTIILPAYFARKWSLEYNEWVDAAKPTEQLQLLPSETKEQMVEIQSSKWIKPNLFLKIVATFQFVFSSVLIAGVLYGYLITLGRFERPEITNESLTALPWLLMFSSSDVIFLVILGTIGGVFLVKKKKLGLYVSILNLVLSFSYVILITFVSWFLEEIVRSPWMEYAGRQAETLLSIFVPLTLAMIALLILANGKTEWKGTKLVQRSD